MPDGELLCFGGFEVGEREEIVRFSGDEVFAVRERVQEKVVVPGEKAVAGKLGCDGFCCYGRVKLHDSSIGGYHFDWSFIVNFSEPTKDAVSHQILLGP